MLTLSDPTDIWVFRRNHQGKWVWQLLSPRGEHRLKCQSTFRSIDDCAGDAGEHGYQSAIDVSISGQVVK